MSKKLTKYLRAGIFIFLFIALVGTFLNQKEDLTGAMAQFYGGTGTNVSGVIMLLFGWVFWEFAIGKKQSLLLAIIALCFFIFAIALIGQLLAFIGIGAAIVCMLPIMLKELKFQKFSEIFRKKAK